MQVQAVHILRLQLSFVAFKSHDVARGSFFRIHSVLRSVTVLDSSLKKVSIALNLRMAINHLIFAQEADMRAFKQPSTYLAPLLPLRRKVGFRLDCQIRTKMQRLTLESDREEDDEMDGSTGAKRKQD